MSNLLKNLLIALVLAGIIWFGYVFLIKEDPEETVVATSQAALEGRAFLAKLQQLDRIQVDNSLFSDPRFNALVDFRQAIVSEPVGRKNPFAPIE